MAQENVSIGITVGLGLFKTIATAYDIVTLPIYSIFQRPWVKRQSKSKIRARQEDPGDAYSGKMMCLTFFPSTYGDLFPTLSLSLSLAHTLLCSSSMALSRSPFSRFLLNL